VGALSHTVDVAQEHEHEHEHEREHEQGDRDVALGRGAVLDCVAEPLRALLAELAESEGSGGLNAVRRVLALSLKCGPASLWAERALLWLGVLAPSAVQRADTTPLPEWLVDVQALSVALNPPQSAAASPGPASVAPRLSLSADEVGLDQLTRQVLLRALRTSGRPGELWRRVCAVWERVTPADPRNLLRLCAGHAAYLSYAWLDAHPNSASRAHAAGVAFDLASYLSTEPCAPAPCRVASLLHWDVYFRFSLLKGCAPEVANSAQEMAQRFTARASPWRESMESLYRLFYAFTTGSAEVIFPAGSPTIFTFPDGPVDVARERLGDEQVGQAVYLALLHGDALSSVDASLFEESLSANAATSVSASALLPAAATAAATTTATADTTATDAVVVEQSADTTATDAVVVEQSASERLLDLLLHGEHEEVPGIESLRALFEVFSERSAHAESAQLHQLLVDGLLDSAQPLQVVDVHCVLPPQITEAIEALSRVRKMAVQHYLQMEELDARFVSLSQKVCVRNVCVCLLFMVCLYTSVCVCVSVCLCVSDCLSVCSCIRVNM
jgi:hypothetical protein